MKEKSNKKYTIVKGRTAIRVFNRFRKLNEKPYWGNHFWSKGYCVNTVGLDADKIARYVKYREAFSSPFRGKLKTTSFGGGWFLCFATVPHPDNARHEGLGKLATALETIKKITFRRLWQKKKIAGFPGPPKCHGSAIAACFVLLFNLMVLILSFHKKFYRYRYGN